MVHLREANPELVQVIEAQVQSRYAAEAGRHARLVNGVLLNIVRAQSQFNVPLVTAAFTILSDVQGVQHTFHETIRRNFPGALMSTNWGDGFLTLANANRPAADDEMLEGVQVGFFDNLTCKLNYGSYVTQEAGGEMKHMTNWLCAELPRRLAPPKVASTRTIYVRLCPTPPPAAPPPFPCPTHLLPSLPQLLEASSARIGRPATSRGSSTSTRPPSPTTGRAGGVASSTPSRAGGCSTGRAWRPRGCHTRSTCPPCSTGCSRRTPTCATR